MDAVQEVIHAAEARARALAEADGERLVALLHEGFRWTTHVGESLDRDEYVRRNTQGHTRWVSQSLGDAQVLVVGDTAVLRAQVTDVSGLDGEPETFRMPMAQVWVRVDRRWTCLAGHAGPKSAR